MQPSPEQPPRHACAPLESSPAESELCSGEVLELPPLDWSSWSLDVSDEWAGLAPGLAMPEQGWKIHCAASVDDAPLVLDVVARLCHEELTSFKYVPTLRRLRWRNSKEAPAAAAAKFVTIYPQPDALGHLVDRLHGALRHLTTPSILGDLRWRASSVHVRFGGFRARTVLGPEGRPVAAIVDPAGHLVPDVRGTGFAPPSWIVLPGILERQREVLASAEPGALRDYLFTSAITMTAAGGVYRATRRRDGVPVVVKEARPGMEVAGRRATARLGHEAQMLDRLADVAGVVVANRAFEADGHHFLELDQADGDSLNRAVWSRNPLVAARSHPDERLAYRDRVLRVAGRVSEIVRRLHEMGIVHGDLHPGNVIVSASDRPVLIDFESASGSTIQNPEAARVGVLGYAAPASMCGPARDRYALAAMTLNAFVPLSFLHPLDPALLDVHVEAARRAFELSGELCDDLRRDLDVWGEPEGRSPGVIDMRPGQLGSDVRVALPVRRRSPLAPSTADTEIIGVCQALHATGGLAPAQRRLFVESLAERAATKGVLGGAGGRAVLAGRLRAPGADSVADRLIGSIADTVDLGLRDGLAGLGLALIADQRRRPKEATASALREVSRRLVDEWRTGEEWQIGLFDGSTGMAAFHIARAAAARDRCELARARLLLIVGADRCASTPDGRFEVRDGPRSLPFLGSGSAGLGVVILAYLEHEEDAQLAQMLPGIERACSAELVVHAGLRDGRAGMMLFLAELARSGRGSALVIDTMARHVERLAWSAVRTDCGVTFPGRSLDATSSDLLDGAAGVLTALDAASRTRAGGVALSGLPDVLLLRAGVR
jgi:tRNA A-37 threonylcarbamoyl transferase component Bud32